MANLKALVQKLFDAEKARKAATSKLLEAQFDLLRVDQRPRVGAVVAVARLNAKRASLQAAEKALDKAVAKEEAATERVTKEIDGGSGWTDADLRMVSDYALKSKRPT